jgi:hypothetical protein
VQGRIGRAAGRAWLVAASLLPALAIAIETAKRW